MRDGLLGVLFRGFRLFAGNPLLVELGGGGGGGEGMRDLSMVDSLVILVDDVNLNRFHLW